MKIQHEIESLTFALQTLEKAMRLFNQYEQTFLDDATEEHKEACIGMRDSMIQRFVCCVDLCWPLILGYIHKTENIDVEPMSLYDVVQHAVNAGILSASDGDIFIEMVVSRDKRTHSYDEQLVEGLVRNMPEYARVMQVVVDRLKI